MLYHELTVPDCPNLPSDNMADLPAILTERCYHYDEFSELPADIKKCVSIIRPSRAVALRHHRYWHQRHKLFSKYDEGIWMTDSAWYGVTPEPVAEWVSHSQTALNIS